MAGKYGMRGEAAGRLSKKRPPMPEDDLGLPPMDEEMPPEGGAEGEAAGLAELLGAAGGDPMAGGAPPPPGGEDEMAPPGAEGPPGQPMDLEGALSGVEVALEGLPPEAAEEIRMHMNAIRQIAASGGEGAPPVDGMAPGGAPEGPDAGSPDMGEMPV